MTVAVVYLARAAEGLEPIRRFAASYRALPSGADHELIVICKGHQSDDDVRKTLENFSSPADVIRTSDDGFDIGAYMEAAEKIKNDDILFLNTFTELLTPNWLFLMHRHLTDQVGIVGAMGSFESVRDTIDFVAKATWLCLDQKLPFDSQLAAQFEWIFNIYAKDWLDRSGSRFEWLHRALRRKQPGSKAVWRQHWKEVTGYPADLSEWLDGFPHFPNPHIRSNGFLVRRKLFKSIVSTRPPTKETAMHFESGVDGYTSRIRKLNLRALVASNTGRCYDVPRWGDSRTFRLGSQPNLIISDNQSRGFNQMPEGTRQTHTRVTWGDYAGSAPAGFIDFGFRFSRNDVALSPPSSL